jgi:NACalpha-BTF3-like transcription factor
VVDTYLDEEAVKVDEANGLDETDVANVADRTNLANEASKTSLADAAYDVVKSNVPNAADLTDKD